MSGAASFFDRLASHYDQMWTNTSIGRAQRDAVWRQLDPLVHPGIRILDLGCGTGEDAVHFRHMGAFVHAIDASTGMIEAARRRGVDARALHIEEAGSLAAAPRFDLVLSNFGALNCVRSLFPLRHPLARILRPGGLLAVCLMNRFCLWETAHYLLRGDLRTASRRWSGSAKTSSGVSVLYPSAARVRRAFHPHFRPLRDLGIGCAVPPSYARLREGTVRRLAKLDQCLAATPARHLADHRLFLFRRSESV